jgi:hypothetical protein
MKLKLKNGLKNDTKNNLSQLELTREAHDRVMR